MTISLLTLAPIIAVALVGMIFLIFRMNAVNSEFIKELQFFLKYRTVAHNRVKAQLAVMGTQFEKLKEENEKLKNEISNKSIENLGFKDQVGSNQFIEEKTHKIEELELEISSIEKVLNSDIKEQLSSYMNELNGLGKRIIQVRREYSAELGHSSLEKLDPMDVA